MWGTVRFSSPHSFSKAQFSHSQPYSGCLLSDPIPWEGLRHGRGLSFQQGLARHLEKPCQDMTVQQGAPKIQPQHHDPRGSFSLRKEPPTVSQQCKPFSCLPSVPRGSCRGIHFTAAPDGSTASPSSCYDGLSAMSGCWEGHLVLPIGRTHRVQGPRCLVTVRGHGSFCRLRNKLQVTCPFPCETGCSMMCL